MKLYTGQRVGNWTLLSKLGSGVDGQVWSVEGEVDGSTEHRAMKLCEPSSNFYQEYEFLRTVNIRGVIRVYEYNTFESWVYYVMDLADGLPFVEYLHQVSKHERYEECIHLLVSITNIIAQLHTLGLMHLDIKSDNLLVSKEGTVTLIDFGKIGFVGDHSVHRKGSHQTMSPEQRSHWHLTPKSDVYSLAVTVYQAFLHTPVPFANIGQPWHSLLNYCPKMEQTFAGFIQQCLHIVPSERPSMSEFHQTMCLTQTSQYRGQYFPLTQTYIGTCPTLLGKNCLLVGHIGSGRRRILHENIRLSYLDGIPVFIAKSKSLKPFHLWRTIVETVLRHVSLKKRTTIIQGIEKEMHLLLPEMFPSVEPLSLNIKTRTLAKAIALVLSRCTPITIILYQLDIADIGSLKIAKYLWTHPVKNLTMWGTSLKEFNWAETIYPSKWTKESDRQLMQALIPTTRIKQTIPGVNPLQTSIKAWHLIAQERNEAMMVEGVSTTSMWALGLLQEPFSPRIAQLLHPNTETLIERGVLEYVDRQSSLRFRFLPFRWMVQQSLMVKDKYKSTHVALVEAWEIVSASKDSLQMLHHLSQSGRLAPTHLGRAMWLAIVQLNSDQLKQWWWLGKLHGLLSSNIAYQIATLLIPLVSGHPIKIERLQSLEKRNLKAAESGVVQYLRFKHELTTANHMLGIQLAEQLLSDLSPEVPKYQSMVYVDLARMYIRYNDPQNCIRLCAHALLQPLTHTFTDIAVQLYVLLSKGHLYSLNLREGLQACKRGLMLQNVPFHSTIELYHTQGAIEYQLGKRAAARISWNTIQFHNSEGPRATLESIRLEVESGKARYHQHRLRQQLALPIADSDKANLQALCWEVAIQMASSRWVKHGYSLGHEPLNDRAKVALAKWYWLIGDLQKGFDLLESSQKDYDGFQVRVEQVRFALLLGHFDWAKQAAHELNSQTELSQFADIHLMLTLCIECIEFSDPAPLLETPLQHEWVEIYLGGLHLLAMRKRLRSENNCDTLEKLERRAKSLNHKLYLALSDPNLYA